MNQLNPIVSMALPLVLIMDPLGNTPVLLALLKRYDGARQRRIILREMIIALGFIFLFYFAGEALLNILSVDDEALRISGGIILFLIAIKMIFPQIEHNNDSVFEAEPFIVPIATPLVAGPSLIASVILLSHQVKNTMVSVPAILLAWVISSIIMVNATVLRKILRERGLVACERLMGMVLVLISVQMLLDGLMIFIKRI